MKLSHIFLTIFVFLAVTPFVSAVEYHHHDVTNNYYSQETINSAINTVYSNSAAAKATAAGQHHFKSTPKLQWSVGAGFVGNESAISFALGLQAGNVFISGNVTNTLFSVKSDPIFGAAASSVF